MTPRQRPTSTDLLSNLLLPFAVMGGDVFAFPVAPGARPARLWPALLLLLLAAAGWAVAHAVDAELLSRLTDAPRSTWPMVAAALLVRRSLALPVGADQS